MKNVIEQIRKIKGVVTVEKAGENMAVVIFEGKPDMFLWGVDFGLGESTTAFWKVPNKEDVSRHKTTFVIVENKSEREFILNIKCLNETVVPVYDREMYTTVIPFSKYISENGLADVWVDFNKSKSLSPDELVDGKIYVDESNGRILRFNKIKNECSISLYSQKCTDGTYYNSLDGYGKSYHYRGLFRLATPSEAQSLIRAEIANGYFHELKDAK